MNMGYLKGLLALQDAAKDAWKDRRGKQKRGKKNTKAEKKIQKLRKYY